MSIPATLGNPGDGTYSYVACTGTHNKASGCGWCATLTRYGKRRAGTTVARPGHRTALLLDGALSLAQSDMLESFALETQHAPASGLPEVTADMWEVAADLLACTSGSITLGEALEVCAGLLSTPNR